MISRSARVCGFRASMITATLLPIAVFAQVSGPLTIKEQGSFLRRWRASYGQRARGRRHAAAERRDHGQQMYVQYQIPLKGARHVPVVFVHGCCLSSKTWETTPDGRMGWSEYFVRKDRSVYLADIRYPAPVPDLIRAPSMPFIKARCRMPRCPEFSMPPISSPGRCSASGRSSAKGSRTSSSRSRQSRNSTSR